MYEGGEAVLCEECERRVWPELLEELLSWELVGVMR